MDWLTHGLPEPPHEAAEATGKSGQGTHWRPAPRRGVLPPRCAPGSAQLAPTPTGGARSTQGSHRKGQETAATGPPVPCARPPRAALGQTG